MFKKKYFFIICFPLLLCPSAIFAQDLALKLINQYWRFYDVNFPADSITFHQYVEIYYEKYDSIADYEAPDQAHGYTFKKDGTIEYWKRYMNHDPDEIIIKKSKWELKKNVLRIYMEGNKFIRYTPFKIDIKYKIAYLDDYKLVLIKMP